MSDSPLLFLHITKTAGGTLKSALKNLQDRQVAFLYGPADLQALKEKATGSVDMIYGHAIHGLHEQLGVAPKYACFMRHPITRTISHYYHLRHVEKGPIGDHIRKSSDINDFFANHQHWEFSNFMSKVISGMGTRKPDPDEPMYEKAIHHIDTQFQFIGFQEYFPLSVRELAKQMGTDLAWSNDVNTGRYTLGDVSPETLDKIESMNRMDIKLYRYCLRKFL